MATYRARRRRGRRVLLWVLLALAAPAPPILLLRWVQPPGSALMLHRGYPVQYRWVPWEEISPYVALAVIASEDQRFAEHHGFDLVSIQRAVTRQEVRRSRSLRGASTLTQQLAKNLFLWPGRSWLRKGLEAWITVWLELLWSKQRILEVYLNVAEMGHGVFGVGAASYAYFGVPPRLIDPWQAARLAAVLPDPRRRSVLSPGPNTAERAGWILDQMQHMGGTAYLRAL